MTFCWACWVGGYWRALVGDEQQQVGPDERLQEAGDQQHVGMT